MARRKQGADLYRHVAELGTKDGEKNDKSESGKPKPKTKKTTVTPPSSTPLPRRVADPKGFLKITGEKGPGKAAKFLLLLDKEEAAAVMGKLPGDEAEAIAREIAAIRRVDGVEARDILTEFGYRAEEFRGRVRGGMEAAKAILTEAFGAEKADEIIVRTIPEAQPKPFSFFADLDADQATALLRKEPPETLALVLTYIDPVQASRILESLPAAERTAVVLLMAKPRRLSHEVLGTMEGALREKIKLVGKDGTEELDGRAALAGILRYMDLSDEKRLLGDIEGVDEELADAVKEKLFTMDTVHHLRDRDLQDALSGIAEGEIALFLKGQDPEIRARILGALSHRRRLLVEDESDILGPVRRSDADEAAKRFLDFIREKEEDGDYVIVREGDDFV